MTIFLTILKVIGIVLLVLLAIVICLLLLILFVPVRYRIFADLQEQKKVNGAVSWLLHIVRVTFSYENEAAVAYLRILFFKKLLWRYPEEEVEEEEVAAEADETKPPVNEAKAGLKGEPDCDADEMDEILEQIARSKADTGDLDEPVIEQVSGDASESMEDNQPKQKAKRKRQSPKAWFTSVVSKVKEWIATVKRIFYDGKKTIKRVLREIQDEKNQAAVLHIKNELFHLLKLISPKKLKMELSYSTGSPDTTGQVLGILAMFPLGYTNRWHIYPDFASDDFYVKGMIDVRGRLFIVSMIALLLRLIADRNCRRLYRRIQK